MSKSKKHKKPNIPPSTLARPRLDAMLDAENAEIETLANQVAALISELGNAPVLGSFVKRFQTAPPEEQERLRGFAARLGSDENRSYLWTVVKRQGSMSDDAKRAALMVLQAMGEDIEPDDLALYLPPARPKAPSKGIESLRHPADVLSLVTKLEEIETDAELSEQDEQRIREFIAQSAFTAPIEQFLHFDRPAEFDSRDYLELGITDADIPELIRMAVSRDLNRAPFPSYLVWAPIHAWRALGQLRASNAVEPLLGLLEYIDEDQDDWIGEDMPLVFGQIGPIALEPLGAYLADATNPLWARVAAENSIHNIGKDFPETREQVIALLTRNLEHYRENDPILNADIIYALSQLRATETLPLIEQAFAAERVDETVNGDWEDLQIQFGLKSNRSKPRSKTLLDSFRLR